MESLGIPVALGRTAEVYAWEEGHILKLFRKWFPLDGVEYEAQIARVVHEAGLPVPAVGEIVEIEGRHGLVYERVIGALMFETMVSRPWTIFRSARLLAELQADMHMIDAVQGLPSQHQRLREKILAAEMLTPELQEAALKALRELPKGNQLCHGDFHPGNVLMTDEGAVVIDWIDATNGNPLADVARSSLLMSKSPLPDDSPIRWILSLVREWFHGAYLRRYFQLRSGDWKEFAVWQIVNAAGRLSEGIPEEQELLALVQGELSS
ncbi:MAG: aminoglycoside phosphotransferase family protein [Candidatus Zixiibacteriota bacterium]